MVDSHYLCVHCHFYQPPRGNPFSSEPLVEPDAAPFTNWNERITAECYRPNAEIGNFDRISFNVGETLGSWLALYAPKVYQRIIKADRQHRKAHGVGNAIAQGVHHTILPLARRDDKVTQVLWGREVFEHRFGHRPAGMWLPEMAVDLETLEVLVEQGIEWTILSERQVSGELHGAGPYWVELPNGSRIKVFLRDEGLSNDIAFNMGKFGGAGRWARDALVPRRRSAGALTLIATDGETFGHHWPGEEQFLYWLLRYEAEAAGYEVVTLGQYAEMVEPIGAVTLRENTAWSCGHGVARWATGCDCTRGSSNWKGGIRRAMDNLRYQLDAVYEDEVRRLQAGDPLTLRNAYIDVVLGRVPAPEFLTSRGLDLPSDAADRLMKLVEAQYYRQRMYSSCTFFFADLDTLSTVYGIANAAYAIKLTQDAVGVDLSREFRQDLSVVVQPNARPGALLNAAALYDDLLGHMELTTSVPTT